MRLTVFGVVVILAMTCAAQQQPRCNPELPRYQQWSASQHFPVRLDAQEQQALAAKLAQVQLGMSMDEVRSRAGAPTYVADGVLQPHSVSCVWGYNFEDEGPEKSTGSKHRVILGFAENGKLVSVIPQRVEGIQIAQIQDKSCEDHRPSPASAVAQTVAAGKTYVADNQRQATVRAKYPAVSLGMSIEQVENLLGKADWVSVMPHGHPASVWVAGEPCERQLAYIFRQEGKNPTDPKAVGVYLSFDDSGKLFRASPQNVEGLKAIGSPVSQ